VNHTEIIECAGAVDIGGTKIAVGLVTPQGDILDQEVCPTSAARDYRTGLREIETMLRRCLARRPGARLAGVGVGCTGPVDPQTGVLGPNTFLPQWEGVGLVGLLEDALGVPAAIENDADAAALGEFAWGAGQGAQRFIYVTVSTGIGCGLVLDGRLYRGAGRAHPELGHLIIDAGRGPRCYCGGRGCWESLASGTGLAGWYNEQRRERGLNEAGAPEIDAREICALAERLDVGAATPHALLAREAVLREGYYLGVGLANLVNAFVPEVIALGGGVMASWPLFEEPVWAVLRQSCSLVPLERVTLRPAALGVRTGLAGAAYVWFHRQSEWEEK
jgi:glucokinase